MKKKMFYYSDPLTDDFASTKIEATPTPADFDYLPENVLYKIGSFIAYYGAAKPFSWAYDKVAFHHRYINKKALKGYPGRFCFANHVLEAGDAYIPNAVDGGRNYIVTGPEAVSIKGIRTLVKMIGALPRPSTVKGAANFMRAAEKIVKRGQSVTVYPEAHIWPYYTKIRPFRDDSFDLPVRFGVPCFSFTNVMLKSRLPFRRRPVVKTYINGPFFPDPSLPRREAAKKLCDEVYESMVREAEKQEQYVTHEYIEKQD